MSATNSTTYYELPVFIATDKPAWLTDWNGAMSAIDTAIKEALTAGENAQTTANTATSSIATINDSLTTINISLTTLTSTVTGLTGSVNTINSLIGNGEPTTSDKTLIGAINEIYAMIGGGAEVDADIVAYDNTTSGLTATNVQDAIDELAQGGSSVDFDLSAHTGSLTPTTTGSFYAGVNDVSYESNADYSIIRLSGGIGISINITGNAWDTVVTIPAIPGAPVPDVAHDLVIGTDIYLSGNNVNYGMQKLTFNTDGTIDVKLYGLQAVTGASVSVCLPAILLFN